MIESVRSYVDQIVASGSGAVVALGLLFVLVALVMAWKGVRS